MRRIRSVPATIIEARSPRTGRESQPHSPPWTITRARPAVAAVIKNEPVRSGRLAFGSRELYVRTRAPHTRAKMPMGIFKANAQRQEPSSMANPPIIGPIADESAKVELQIATAVPRRSAGQAATASPSDAGAAMAAPMPMSPLAATKVETVGIKVRSADPRTKHPNPMLRTRRRPNRSAHRPLTMRNPA